MRGGHTGGFGMGGAICDRHAMRLGSAIGLGNAGGGCLADCIGLGDAYRMRPAARAGVSNRMRLAFCIGRAVC